MAMVNGCPSISPRGHRCDRLINDGHDFHFWSSTSGDDEETWDDDTAKKRIVLVVTTTEEYEIDLERLGPVLCPDAPGDLAALYTSAMSERQGRSFEDIVYDFFERHEGSVYGDELMGNLNYDRGLEIVERSWHD